MLVLHIPCIAFCGVDCPCNRVDVCNSFQGICTCVLRDIVANCHMQDAWLVAGNVIPFSYRDAISKNDNLCVSLMSRLKTVGGFADIFPQHASCFLPLTSHILPASNRCNAYCATYTHFFTAGCRGSVWRLNVYVQCGRILCEFEIVWNSIKPHFMRKILSNASPKNKKWKVSGEIGPPDLALVGCPFPLEYYYFSIFYVYYVN